MSARSHAAPLLDASIRIDHLPPEGRELDVEADAKQRQSIAERLGISAVDRLAAKLRLSRFRGGMRVEGHVEAVTVQPCVVTLVPVRQVMDEEIDRIFLPAAEQPTPSPGHAEAIAAIAEDAWN